MLGALFLAEMIHRSGNHLDIEGAAEGAAYDSPRGTMHFLRHRTRQPVHLAIADGLDFEIVTTLDATPMD